MEDNLNIFQMEDYLNFFSLNGRQQQKFFKCRINSFFQMED